MATRFGGRYSRPLAGSADAAGGALQDLDLWPLGLQESVVYVNDFLAEADYDATNDWTLTAITGGTAAFTGAGTGVLRLDAPLQDQGPIVQLDGGGTSKVSITPAAGSATAFPTVAAMGARFALTDADASDMFVGLAELNATSAVLTAAGALTSDTHIGFHLLNADDGAMRFSVAGDDDTAATTVESVTTLADATFVEVAVRVTGTTGAKAWYRLGAGQWVQVFDGVSPQAWDAEMFLTVATVGDAAGDDLDLDYVWFVSRRDLTVGS